MEKNTGNTIKKVVVIGPESTGKSTLSAQLAAHFKTEWVPEYARTYIEQLDRPYTKTDLLNIAKGQVALEDKKTAEVDQLLICDTDLIVIKIWSEHKYKSCDDWILETIKQRHYDLYLLTDIDLPWEDDPQRENPHLREHFFKLFEQHIKKTEVPFIIISGGYDDRLQTAIKAINQLF